MALGASLVFWYVRTRTFAPPQNNKDQKQLFLPQNMLSLAHIGLASSFDALLAGWLEVVVRGLVDRRFDQQTNFSAVPTWRLPQHMNLMLNIFADSLQASPTVLTLNIYKKDILSGEKIYLQKYICRPLTSVPPPPSPSNARYVALLHPTICILGVSITIAILRPQ